nr:MAG TPA: hypothetical protein [Caudoviricetes sp.]
MLLVLVLVLSIIMVHKRTHILAKVALYKLL